MLGMELLSAVMGLAVFVMACAQLKLVLENETSVESSDNSTPTHSSQVLSTSCRRPDDRCNVQIGTARSQNLEIAPSRTLTTSGGART